MCSAMYHSAELESAARSLRLPFCHETPLQYL
jgi:hypothetical protein